MPRRKMLKNIGTGKLDQSTRLRTSKQITKHDSAPLCQNARPYKAECLKQSSKARGIATGAPRVHIAGPLFDCRLHRLSCRIIPHAP